MNRIIFVALAIVLCASVSFAQNPGAVGIFSDNTPGPPINRSISATGGITAVYIWHVGTDQVLSSSWKLEIGSLGWTYVGENVPWGLTLGNVQDGIAISYQACQSGDIFLGSVLYNFANAPNCSLIWIAPNPVSVTGRVEAFDCADNRIFPEGWAATVNPDGSCDVPVEETTWGKVKSLYQ